MLTFSTATKSCSFLFGAVFKMGCEKQTTDLIQPHVQVAGGGGGCIWSRRSGGVSVCLQRLGLVQEK